MNHVYISSVNPGLALRLRLDSVAAWVCFLNGMTQKVRSNLAKHSITFEEAATVFGDIDSITITDPGHSSSEERYIILGLSYKGKLLIVVHTERGESTRIISARAANRKERKSYEENL